MNTLKQLVRIERLSEIIEEEVVVSLRGRELTCFASMAPYKLTVGKDYPARFSLVVFDEYRVENAGDASESITSSMAGDYSHEVVGRLVEGHLCACGFVFENSALESEYAYLDGNMVSMGVDRIDVEFLRG